METQRLEPGPELDALVSKQVFGRKYVLCPYVVTNGTRYDEPTWLREGESPDAPWPGIGPGQTPPWYSRSIPKAWEVVEKLRDAGWLVVVKAMPEGFPFRGEHDSERWQARYAVELTWMPLQTAADMRRAIYLQPCALADSLPEAVCRAALEAVRQLER